MLFGIAGVIAWTGRGVLRDVSAVMTDAAVADVGRIARAAGAVPGVEGVHRVRARGVAGAVRVDLHITVDPLMPVVRAHELTHRVRERVRQEVGGVAEVLVHVEPNRSRTTRRTSRCGSHARAPPLRRDATLGRVHSSVPA